MFLAMYRYMEPKFKVGDKVRFTERYRNGSLFSNLPDGVRSEYNKNKHYTIKDVYPYQDNMNEEVDGFVCVLSEKAYWLSAHEYNLEIVLDLEGFNSEEEKALLKMGYR